MSDINSQKNLPKKFSSAKVYGKSNYIGIGNLYDNLKTIVSTLNIESLTFRYERRDKKNLLGHFTEFDFWLESNDKKLVLLDCTINRNSLYDFLSILNRFCHENKINLDNRFEKDSYNIDSLKKEIVRDIYRGKN